MSDEDVPLTAITGIGEKYADEILSMGYKNALDVLHADPREMQRKTDLFNVTRASQLIKNAKSLFNERWEDMQYEPGQGYYDAGVGVYYSSDGKKQFTDEADWFAYERKLRSNPDKRVVAFEEGKVSNLTNKEIISAVYEAASERENMSGLMEESQL